MTPPSERDAEQQSERDDAFAATALPLLPTIARVAKALTGDSTDTEDLVQETYLRAYRHWHTFQPGSDCKSWLATICRHTFAELRRRQSRSVTVDDQELESLAAARVHATARAKGVDDMFARVDLGPAIAKAVRELEPHYRDVVLLVDVDGFSYDEVATTLDIPVGTVRSRLYRARRHLQEALLNYAIDAGYASSSYTLPPPPNHPGERRNA
jgi:RNA polymerase sigma-70 factor (ECF subfamily)